MTQIEYRYVDKSLNRISMNGTIEEISDIRLCDVKRSKSKNPKMTGDGRRTTGTHSVIQLSSVAVWQCVKHSPRPSRLLRGLGGYPLHGTPACLDSLYKTLISVDTKSNIVTSINR